MLLSGPLIKTKKIEKGNKMEHLPTLEQPWFFIEKDSNNFTIVDSEGFRIADNIDDEKTVNAIINNHNLTLKDK